jgi:methionyl-tRNA formyltransferase
MQRTKVLACLDNYVGLESLRFLLDQKDVEILAVVVHPKHAALHHDDIIALCDNHSIVHWDIETARACFAEHIEVLKPDYLFSLYFDYILEQRWLDLAKNEAINLHPGYLPYNKGFYSYVWSVLDGTPAGVSLHRMNSEVDTGELISQARIRVELTDTGETLYKKHEDASISLFRHTWPSIVAGKYRLCAQRHTGTRHKIKETRALLQIDPHEKVKAIDLINRLRATSFADGGGCRIELDGQIYELHLDFRHISEDEPSQIKGCRSEKKTKP